MDKALDGLMVVELAEGWAGPLCGKLMVELGAEVIKVEPPKGDRLRSLGPFRKGVSYAFELASAGKESVVLDLAHAQDRGSLLRLLRSADVLISDRPDELLASFGWDERQLEGELPHLINCWVTPFGRTGPLADWAGNELVAQAMSAAMCRTGYPDDPPTRIGFGLAEHAAAGFAAIGVLAALNWRTQSRLGQSVDVALLDCMIHYLTNRLPNFFASGRVPPKLGNMAPNSAPFDSYHAQDGHILICTQFDRQFVDLFRLLGREDMVSDPRFKTAPDRYEHRHELDSVISAWTSQRTISEIVEALDAIRINTSPFVTTEVLLHDEHFLTRGMLQEHDHPIAGSMPTSGPLFKMSETPGAIPGRAPLLGEHTEAVLTGAERVARPQRSDAPAHLGERPLDGIRVIELGDQMTGPFCARILANLGAEVLKIEPPGGVRSRIARPQVNGIPYFLHLTSCDKKSVTVDLSSQRGRDLFLDLIAKVDIVVENFGPWTMPKLGLEYDVLAQANPRLIYASIKGYGLTGPSSHKGGNDGVIQAASGMARLSGWPDHDPVRAGLSVDPPAGTFTSIAILAALHYRQRSGKGQFIDMSMHDLAGWMTQQAWPSYFATGRSPGPMGNRHRLFAPNNSYRARDGLLVIGVESDAEWESLVRVTG
ncbi:MAG: CoA transferase, partial [Chloroflexi bacterium]|nr:CoA transferase [Chloroflexota bacterium]